MELRYHEHNPLLPHFTLFPKLKETLAEPWKKALVVNPLRRNSEYMTSKEKIIDLWHPRGGIDILTLGHGYYLL